MGRRRPLGVKPVFRPKRTLKRELMQVKSRTPEQKQTGVVYKIPCKECPEVYVGETKRTLKVRLSEHRQAVKRGDPKNGIAVHVQKTNHCINWEGATGHPDQESHPEHEPGQRPPPTHGLEPYPQTTLTPHLAPFYVSS